MHLVKFSPVALVCLALTATGVVCAQSSDINNKPSVVVGTDRPKPLKPGTSKTIQGTVKDAADNPAAGAIVQLKNTKHQKEVAFITKDDGKYAFRELFLDVEYTLLAKRGDITTPLKKASPYDTRKDITINFKLEPPPKQP